MAPGPASAPASAKLVKQADAICAKEPQGMLDPRALAGKPKRFELRFDGDAATMVPTPATAKLLEAWGHESPDFWWNAAP